MKRKKMGVWLLGVVLLCAVGCTTQQVDIGKQSIRQPLDHLQLAQSVVLQKELTIARAGRMLKPIQQYKLPVAAGQRLGLSCASEAFILYTGERYSSMAQKPELVVFYLLDRESGQSREIFKAGEQDIGRLVTAGEQFFWLEEDWEGQWRIVAYDPRQEKKQTIAQGVEQEVSDIAAQGYEVYWLVQQAEGTSTLSVYQAVGGERQSVDLHEVLLDQRRRISLTADRLSVISAEGGITVYQRLSGRWRNYPVPAGVLLDSDGFVQTDQSIYWIKGKVPGRSVLYSLAFEGGTLTEWTLPAELHSFWLIADEDRVFLMAEQGLYQLETSSGQLSLLYTANGPLFCQILSQGLMIEETDQYTYLQWR